MTALAWLFVLVGALPLLGLVATAKPTRGENLMGLHLVVAPMALALTLGLGLGIAAGWRSTALPAAALYAALPGYGFACIGLVFACFGRSEARFARLSTLLAVAATVVVVLGDVVAPEVQLAGGIAVVAIGVVATLMGFWMAFGFRLRRLFWRFARRMSGPSAPQPGSFEAQLAEQHRARWAERGEAAGFAELLELTRPPETAVRDAAVGKLVAAPDFEANLVAAIAAGESRDAQNCVRLLTPKRRARLADSLVPRLDDARAHFLRRVAERKSPKDEVELAMRLLDAGVGAYLAGGKIGGALARWRDALLSHPDTAKDGRDLRKVLWLVRLRRCLGRS